MDEHKFHVFLYMNQRETKRCTLCRKKNCTVSEFVSQKLTRDCRGISSKRDTNGSERAGLLERYTLKEARATGLNLPAVPYQGLTRRGPIKYPSHLRKRTKTPLNLPNTLAR